MLLEAVKTRQKFLQADIRSYDKVREGDNNTTEKIFWENGFSPWLAYIVTKRHAESTSHASGKAKRQRLLERIEARDVDARRRFAAQVAAAIEPERERLEAVGRVVRRQSERGRHEHSSTRDTTPHETPRRSASGLPEARPHLFTNASIAECTRLFPLYMATSIKRKADPDDAQGLVAAVSLTLKDTEGLGQLQLDIMGNKVEYLAKELFEAHFESEAGVRYVYLGNGTTKAIPNPSVILRGGRPTAIRGLFGAEIAEGVFASSLYQREVKEGRGECTDCVSMTVIGMDSAEISILLSLEKAVLLRTKLYT